MAENKLVGAVTDGATAAAGAAVPVVGAAIAQALGKAFTKLFGGGPSRWDTAGPWVHDWFTRVGEQAFLDWMQANAAGAFADLDTVKFLRMVWGAQNNGGFYVGFEDPKYRMTDLGKMRKMFADIGIDIDASRAKQAAAGRPANELSPNNLVGVPAAAPVVAKVQEAVNRSATGQSLSPIDKGIVKDMTKAANTGAGGGMDLNKVLPLLLVALVLIFVFK